MATKAPVEAAVHSVKETARKMRTDVGNVYALINMGYIKPMKLGAQMISNIEINRFLSQYAGVDLKSEIRHFKQNPDEWRKEHHVL